MADSDGLASSASFLNPPSLSDENNDIDSLPSEPDSDEVTVSEEDYSESDAEKEWKESLQQLELLLSMVIVPYVGKYFGRKFAYWGRPSAALVTSVETANGSIKVGNSSWSGNIPSKSSSQTRPRSKALEQSKLLPHYDPYRHVT
jgi:hypothetical protein